jgi:hypothetical protein
MVRLLLILSVIAGATAISATPADASGGTLTLKFGPAVYHYRSDPDHHNSPWLLGADWEQDTLWSMGGVMFRNSFDQRSQYFYVGKRWFPLTDANSIYVKVTGGVMFGYREPYDDKIPFNHRNGIAPAILPAVGYQMDRSRVQLVPLGTAGLLLTYGVHL